jgi:tetratricopeptide (TPR) repeat protein
VSRDEEIAMMLSSDRLATTGFINAAAFPALEPDSMRKRQPTEQGATELMDKAYECLDSCDAKGALKIGKKLKSMKYSGGFEIMAMAYVDDDQKDKAIECLEEGVKTCPDRWILWQMLGNYRSNQDEFDKAMACYDKAAACPNGDTSSVNLNRAVCLCRQGLNEKAINTLQRVTSEDWRIERESVRVGCLVELRRFDEAIRRGEELTKEIGASEGLADKYLSRTFSWLARAFLEGKKDKEKARAAVESALERDKGNDSALATLREVNNLPADDKDKLIWIMVEGQWPAPLEIEGEEECPGFYTNYWVVASTPREAFEFAREVERRDVRASLKISKHNVRQREAWQKLRGVYSRTGYVFFPEKELGKKGK